MYVHGIVRLKGCWIVTANYIPSYVTWIGNVPTYKLSYLATRLTVMYDFLWSVFGPDSIGNAIKTVSLHSTAIVWGVMVCLSLWKPLPIFIKITQSGWYFYALLMNLVATVALVRNLVGLLQSTIIENSNKTIKLATVFQNSTENYKGHKTMCVLLYSVTYLTSSMMSMWKLPPSHPSINEGHWIKVWQPEIEHKNQNSSWSIHEQDSNRLAHQNKKF